MAGRKRKQRDEAIAASAEGALAGGVLPSLGRTSRPLTPGPESAVAERVRHIADLMVSGHYRSYATRVELAAAWGVAESTIRNYSAEASHLVAFDPEERDRMRVSLAAQCRQVREDAMSSANNVTGLPDYGSAIRATELEAKFIGIDLEPVKKVEMTGKDGGPIETKDVTYDEVLGSLSRLAAEGGEGKADPEPQPEGSGDSQVHLGVLGETKPA